MLELYTESVLNLLAIRELIQPLIPSCHFQLFTGNKDRSTTVLHLFSTPVVARYVRFVPETWSGKICMRVQIYGCAVSKFIAFCDFRVLSLLKKLLCENLLLLSPTSSKEARMREPWNEVDCWFFHKSVIERFSNDCRKTKSKAITPTNHNRRRQRNEPITIPSNSL